jgi:hypothetical protein
MPSATHEMLEALSHVNDGAQDGGVIRTGSRLVDKGLVDSQDIDGEPAKITQAEGTEVIYRKAYAHALEFLKYGDLGRSCEWRRR